MTGKQAVGWAVLGLALGLLSPRAAQAGPYFGEWGFWYHPHDCPRGSYSPLHYWAVDYYKLRAFCSPSYLDQFPPGPYPPVPPTFVYTKYRCPPVSPAPTAPYADPAAYYGRSVTGQIDGGIDLPPQPATAPTTPQGPLPTGQLATQLPTPGVTSAGAVLGPPLQQDQAPARSVLSVTSQPPPY
jgi:hypothetical protein